MSTNLAQNIKCSQKLKRKNFFAWSYSTAALHWLKDEEEYQVFVSNRVAKIREHSYLEWNYASARNNPADLGSRDCELR